MSFLTGTEPADFGCSASRTDRKLGRRSLYTSLLPSPSNRSGCRSSSGVSSHHSGVSEDYNALQREELLQLYLNEEASTKFNEGWGGFLTHRLRNAFSFVKESALILVSPFKAYGTGQCNSTFNHGRRRGEGERHGEIDNPQNEKERKKSLLRTGVEDASATRKRFWKRLPVGKWDSIFVLLPVCAVGAFLFALTLLWIHPGSVEEEVPRARVSLHTSRNAAGDSHAVRDEEQLLRAKHIEQYADYSRQRRQRMTFVKSPNASPALRRNERHHDYMEDQGGDRIPAAFTMLAADTAFSSSDLARVPLRRRNQSDARGGRADGATVSLLSIELQQYLAVTLARHQKKLPLMEPGAPEAIAPLQTDVIIHDFMNSQYVIEVGVGTPPQIVRAIADTGSSDFWACSEKCGVFCMLHKVYHHSKSSSYLPDNSPYNITVSECSRKQIMQQLQSSVAQPQSNRCTGTQRAARQLPTGEAAVNSRHELNRLITISRPCLSVEVFRDLQSCKYAADGAGYIIQYVGGPVSGFLSLDNVSVGDLTAQHLLFAEADNVKGLGPAFFFGHFDGVLGMGLPATATHGLKPLMQTAIEQNLLKKWVFAFYLSSDDSVDGELTLGGYDASRIDGSIVYTPLVDKRYWMINSQGLQIKEDVISSTTRVIIDSGTTLIAGPLDEVDRIARMFGAFSVPMLPKGTYLISCEEAFVLEDLALMIEGHAFTVRATDLVIKVSDIKGVPCLFGMIGLQILEGIQHNKTPQHRKTPPEKQQGDMLQQQVERRRGNLLTRLLAEEALFTAEEDQTLQQRIARQVQVSEFSGTLPAAVNPRQQTVQAAGPFNSVALETGHLTDLGRLWIFGDIFMRGAYTIFDYDEKRIGFAKLRSTGEKKLKVRNMERQR